MTESLDALDQQIIEELRRDGRQANTEIARRLGVSETTIRSRVQRLVREDIVQVRAAVNPETLGFDVYVLIGVQCAPGKVPEVMRSLVSLSEVRWVSAVTGRWSLIVTASFLSKGDLYAFVTDGLGRMPGVSRAEALHVLREIKRDYYYWDNQLTSSKTRDGARGEESITSAPPPEQPTVRR